MRVHKARHPGLIKAITAAGSMTELARRIKVSAQAIWQWEAVPVERVLKVEEITGVSRYELRPDIYGEMPTERERKAG